MLKNLLSAMKALLATLFECTIPILVIFNEKLRKR